MKKSNLIYLLILPFIFSSCDFLDKFDHFGVGNTFEESFQVSVPAGSVSSYAGSVSFDASDDATLEENLENIREFEVTSISLRITKTTTNTVTADGSFAITSDGAPVGDPVTVNLDLSSEEEVILPLSTSTYRAVKDAYLAHQKITIAVAGSVSETPIDVEFTIYMAIEATIDN